MLIMSLQESSYESAVGQLEILSASVLYPMDLPMCPELFNQDGNNLFYETASKQQERGSVTPLLTRNLSVSIEEHLLARVHQRVLEMRCQVSGGHH